jgi:hypothetical protein
VLKPVLAIADRDGFEAPYQMRVAPAAKAGGRYDDNEKKPDRKVGL